MHFVSGSDECASVEILNAITIPNPLSNYIVQCRMAVCCRMLYETGMLEIRTLSTRKTD